VTAKHDQPAQQVTAAEGTAPPGASPDEVIDRVLDALLYVAATLGALAVAGSLVRWVQHGWHVQYGMHLVVYLVILTGLVAGRRFPRTARVAILLAPLGLNAVGNLYWNGLASTGILTLATFCVLAAILAGLRAAILALAASLIAIALIGVGVHNGAIPVLSDPQAYLRSGTEWFAFSSLFATLVVTVILCVTFIQKAYSRSLEQLQAANAGLQREVEERRRVERELAEREEKYRLLAETARDGIFTQDMNLKLTYVSPSGAAMFGYEPEELMSLGLQDMLTRASLERALESFAQMAARAREGAVEVPLMEYECVRKDGSTFWGELQVTFLHDEQGRPVGVQGALRDITDRKHAEAEQERLEEQLQQTDRLQAIGRLAGGVAHDFNNQLAGIMGYAELLKREFDKHPRVRDYADNILAPARRASDLTAKLLAFARKGKYSSEPVDLHAVVGEVVAILKRSIPKTIHIHQELGAASAAVLGDATQLQNAVLNIALNARDAMPNGGKLTIRTEVGDGAPPGNLPGRDNAPGGPRLLLRVGDTGVGMDAETRQRAFEPFFTTKERGHGTGMGLAAVYGTVRSHGGSIEVRSAPGQGTTFTIALPLLHGADGVRGNDGEQRAVTGSGRVLVVDDEAVVRTMTARMLERLGYEVLLSEHSSEAMKIYEKQWREIDLVLLDMMLPGISGRATFDGLRRVNPRARVLLFSGYSADGEADALVRSGAVGFLQKPFSFAGLSESIAAAMTAKQ
jgi:PAS domain S-box-containing protein